METTTSKNRIAIIEYKSPTRAETIAVQYEDSEGWEAQLKRQGFVIDFCSVLADFGITMTVDKYRIQRFARAKKA